MPNTILKSWTRWGTADQWGPPPKLSEEVINEIYEKNKIEFSKPVPFTVTNKE